VEVTQHRARPSADVTPDAVATERLRQSRGLAGGVLAGFVAAGPALGAALLSACLGCLGFGSAAAAGVAAGAGLSLGGVAAGLVVLAFVVLLQVFRARRSCPVGHRTRYLRRRITVVVLTGVATFGLLQWLVATDVRSAEQRSEPAQVQRLP
jgi:hypothetical protein